MAYPCSYNTQADETSSWAEWANYFSNPDVDYLGLPTGTDAENNARLIRENMVRANAAGIDWWLPMGG